MGKKLKKTSLNSIETNDFPVKVKAYLQMLKGTFTKKNNPILVACLHTHARFIAAFNKLSQSERLDYYNNALSFASKNISLCKQEVSFCSSAHNIETTAYILRKFLGFSTYEKQRFQMSSELKIIKLISKKRQETFDLKVYFARKSSNQSQCLILECLDYNIQQCRKLSLKFQNRVVYNAVYNELRKIMQQQINKQIQRLNNKQVYKINELILCNNKNILYYKQYKNRFLKRLQKKKFELIEIGEIKNSKILYCHKNKNLYKIIRKVQMNIQKVKECMIFINKKLNKRILKYQIIQSNYNINTVYYNFQVKNQLFDLIALTEQNNHNNQYQFTIQQYNHKINSINIMIINLLSQSNSTLINIIGLFGFQSMKQLAPIYILDLLLAISNFDQVLLDQQFKTVFGNQFSQNFQNHLQKDYNQGIYGGFWEDTFYSKKNKIGSQKKVYQNNNSYLISQKIIPKTITKNGSKEVYFVNDEIIQNKEICYQSSQSQTLQTNLNRQLSNQHTPSETSYFPRYNSQGWVKHQKGLVCLSEKCKNIQKVFKELYNNGQCKEISINYPQCIELYRPQSILQSIAYNISYGKFLLDGELTQIQKMKRSILFMISMSVENISLYFPFPSYLGQTYQIQINNSLFYAQQTHINPSISHYYLEGKGYSIMGIIQPKISINNNQLYYHNGKYHSIKWNNGTQIVFNNPNLCIQGLMSGQRITRLYGINYLTNNNNLIAEIVFESQPQNKNNLSGRIIQVTQQFAHQFRKQTIQINSKHIINVPVTFLGSWNDKIYFNGHEQVNYSTYTPSTLCQKQPTLPSDTLKRKDIAQMIKGNQLQTLKQQEQLLQRDRLDAQLRLIC